MKVPRSCVINLIKQYKCDPRGIIKGKEVWETASPHNLTIRLPGSGDIPYALVEIICLEILNMGIWEYDYFLGECGFMPPISLN